MAQDSLLDRIGATPLVRLQNIGRELPAPIYVKCEHLSPGGSVKDRIARAIVQDAEAQGRLQPGDTLVEATAGNTGVGLALVAALRGYRLACVMPEKMSVDKRAALRAMGAEVIVTDNAPLSDPQNFRNVARRLAEARGWFLTDQFANPANPRAHEATGAEICAQLDGPIGAFVSGAGTGGTITGVGRHLARAQPTARVVLADPIGSGLADWVETGTLGPQGAYAIEGVGGSAVPANLDASVIHEAVRVPDAAAFEMVGRLAREEGLYVGGSAGANVVAALEVARRALPGPVVTVMCDGWDRYVSQPWMQALGRPT